MIIYLAGGLFNAGERLHNLYLEESLKKLGYKVILPQREALKAFDGNGFDTKAIVENCRDACSDPQNFFVGSADGADSDSGTCVEYGVAITSTGRALVYCTDFRTDLEKELGVNAMLTGEGTVFIYEPCFFTELDQVNSYYKELAEKIHKAILSL
ncbi:MAG: nucleoside 2-deoxyribosyltransferase [Candidatus Andersenbacteria bacterium]|nr:nucleoside 2-deoxyribosyltransferase [Candidatus Andersenbacteria bacterium]